MRLTCPNCGAQYEVPQEVIPEAGRDVQCSNCGDTWFQHHPDHASDEAAEADHGADLETEAGDDDVADTWEDAAIPARGAAPAAEDFASPAEPPQNTEDISDSEDTDDSADAASDGPPGSAAEDAAMPPPVPPRVDEPATDTPPLTTRSQPREVDPSVFAVLREEAEREKRARAEAQQGLETQPELGLGEDESRSGALREREARQRMARMRGLDDTGGDNRPSPAAPQDDDDRVGDIDPKSRRSLFPDIEEINSSLGPEDAAYAGANASDGGAYDEATPRKKGGFVRGFLLSVLLAVLALLLYVFAAPLAGAVPALEGVLADYVVWVDGLRAWLDMQVAALMAQLDTLVGNTPPANEPSDTGN